MNGDSIIIKNTQPKDRPSGFGCEKGLGELSKPQVPLEACGNRSNRVTESYVTFGEQVMGGEVR